MRDSEKSIEYGRLLIVEGMVTGEDIRESCSIEETVGDPIVDAALMATPLTRDDLALFLSRRCLIPKLAGVDGIKCIPELAAQVPEETARRLKIVPLARWGDILVVASEDIFNIEAVAELRQSQGMRVKMVQLDKGRYEDAVNRAYGNAIAEPVERPLPAEPTPEAEPQEVVVVEFSPVVEVAAKDETAQFAAAVAQGTSAPPSPVEKVIPLAISMDEYHAMEFAVNWQIVNEWQRTYATDAPIEPSKIS